MAIIKSQRGISFEVIFSGYSDDWVKYEFIIKYEDQPIRSERISLLKVFQANDDDYDRLIPTFEKSMKSGQFVSWVPLEPDAWIEIQPIIQQGYKDIQAINRGNQESLPKKLIDKLKNVDEMHRQKKLNPDDDFRVSFFADTIYYNFPKAKADGSLGYTENGIGISFLVNRSEFGVFVEKLKDEYKIFTKKLKIVRPENKCHEES